MKKILLIALLPIFTSTGDVFPTSGTIANRSGGVEDWANPGNILADDGSVSSVVTFSQTHYLIASGFGFSVPAGAIILGITVKIEGYSDFPPNPQLRTQLQDNNGSLIGNPIITQTMSGGAVYTVYTYGGASDVWGASLTPTIVNDADFGVRMWVGSLSDVRIDYVKIAVEFTNRRAAIIN